MTASFDDRTDFVNAGRGCAGSAKDTQVRELSEGVYRVRGFDLSNVSFVPSELSEHVESMGGAPTKPQPPGLVVTGSLDGDRRTPATLPGLLGDAGQSLDVVAP
ncbi:hypothetical protein ACIBKY_46385 [Nonomuraea sp. NPDC050394]|uniref:hypothetical protein n=1 Tax=Nonomuraea sp. NPDC050394 TaxID=3364363 RepID=UPI0037AE06DC